MVRRSHFIFDLLKAVSVVLKRYCVSEEWGKETHRKVFESLLSFMLTRKCMELLTKQGNS